MKHNYKGTPISIDWSEIKNDPGVLSSTKVEVFYDDAKIGEYIRHYPSFIKATFYPFKMNNEWYALYSADYTATRVAKLTQTEFLDWCGEEGGAMGFCPTEFYVPRYKLATRVLQGKNGPIHTKEYTFDNDFPEKRLDEYFEYSGDEDEEYLGESYAEYGFLSGCYWGDDSSWKLRFIDLKGVLDKNLVIDERFGYFELPYDRTLRECVRNQDLNSFELLQKRNYSITEGKFWGDE